MKLLITNVVYGEKYADLFLNQNLRSLLQQSNVPAHKERIEMTIYTDELTEPLIETHENFKKMKELVPVNIVKFLWNDPNDHYGQRYPVLINFFREAVATALEKNMWLSFLVADLVIGSGFIKNALARLDQGYDGFLTMPMRSGAETMTKELDRYPWSLQPLELFQIAYKHMCPLFLMAHWRNPTFTHYPFSLIWNMNGSGLLIRSYSITPIALKPNKKMLNSKKTVDEEIPSMLDNPYVVTDWTEAPIVCLEFLKNFYPAHQQIPSSIPWVRVWSRRLHPSQIGHLKHKLYYPNKEMIKIDQAQEEESDLVVEGLMK